jgi:hypothetical protein
MGEDQQGAQDSALHYFSTHSSIGHDQDVQCRGIVEVSCSPAFPLWLSSQLGSRFGCCRTTLVYPHIESAESTPCGVRLDRFSFHAFANATRHNSAVGSSKAVSNRNNWFSTGSKDQQAATIGYAEYKRIRFNGHIRYDRSSKPAT